MKTINPTVGFKGYMELQIRYLKFICATQKIDMLMAIDQFAYRFKVLYCKKHTFQKKTYSEHYY